MTEKCAHCGLPATHTDRVIDLDKERRCQSEPGYKTIFLCLAHALEAKQSFTSRVTPLPISLSRGVPIEGGSEIIYQYQFPALRLKIAHMTNHELRAVLLGLWALMDKDDQQDFVTEINHYASRPFEELPPLSQSLARAAGD